MIRTFRRTTAILVVALTAVGATTLGATPAQADDQPILPILKLLTPPRATPTPAPAKPAASPTKHATPKPAKHKTTHKKKKRAAHTATPTRSVTTTASSVVSAPTTSSSATRPAKATPRKQRQTEQVAAPNFAATEPVRPAQAASQRTPTATAELVSSGTSTGALPLWVPAGLVGMLALLTGGALWNRRRNGGF